MHHLETQRTEMREEVKDGDEMAVENEGTNARSDRRRDRREPRVVTLPTSYPDAMSHDEQTIVHDARDDVDATDVVPPVLDDDAYLFDPLETPVPASLEGEAAPVIPTGYSEGNAHGQ